MDILIQYLKKVKDFRRRQGQTYPLWFILLIVILGIMSGHLGYRALGDYAKFNRASLLKYFPIHREKTPSYSTIRRAMMGVDWQDLSEIFNQWARHLLGDNSQTRWQSIDGKSLKSTVENYATADQNFVLIISQFCQETNLVTKLDRIENKHTSELHQVQDSLKVSDAQNQVFTLDALHCQTETLKAITETGNDYLVAVKKNQPNLYKSVETQAKITVPISEDVTMDNSHGRSITRKVSVFQAPQQVQSKWSNSQTVIQVVRQGYRDQKSYEEIAYYLSSRRESAAIFGEKIRGHWGIENRLHWVKDVILQEDKSPIHDSKTMTNFAILSTIALNLFRILGFLSITECRRWLRERFWLLTILLA